MKEDLIADIWNTFIELIPEKAKKDTAYDFINVLLDNGVKESVLESLLGVDPHLDDAIEYAIDSNNTEEDDYYEDEE
jgi:spermidine/putrescine-binding protein